MNAPTKAELPRRKIIPETGCVQILVGHRHPLADRFGYAWEHVLVWCAAGADRPPPGMLLRHRNGDRSDNRLENLELAPLRRSDAGAGREDADA